MRNSFVFAFAVIAAVSTLAGAADRASDAVMQLQPSQSRACPVGLMAEQRSGSELMRADVVHPGVPAQVITLVLQNRGTREIVAAEATVHGLSFHGRVLPLGSAGRDDIAKTFQLDRRIGAKGTGDSDLSIERVSTIRWVDLDSITYADGSVWHASEQSKCRAVPDPIMLISSR